MSLEISKLGKVRELPGGIVQARCPACAEGGHDRTGEHLRIYPDGRFGCCVHPKDGQHRKRIWALAGGKMILPPSKSVSLRMKAPISSGPGKSVKAALSNFTVQTSGIDSENSVLGVPNASVTNFGTLGTGNSELRACARVKSTAHIDIGEDLQEELKDSETAVPSVPLAVAAEPLSAAGERLPHLTPGGSLVIPFDSAERYHWWKPEGKRLSVAEIQKEVKERMKDAITI